MKRNQNGFAHIGLLLFTVATIGIVAFASYYFFQQRTQNTDFSSNNDMNTSRSVSKSCPSPVFSSPVDVSLVTSVLYPGQVRGGNYKPHGGFRFDDLPNNLVEVTAPIDAKLVGGARYIERGEQQILLDFESNCGIKFRFDHLLTVDPKIQREVEKLPGPKKDDSRTTNFNAPISVKAGEVIASAVGFKSPLNVSVDFGVYDTRQEGGASTSNGPAGSRDELSQTAVCWFDYLPKSDATTLRSLPAGDQAAGKSSDYCK